MRIKYVANVRIPTPRAQGYAIMKMCSEFSKAGCEVELLVPNRKNTESIEKNPFDFYGIEGNFRIKKVPSPDFLGRTMKFGKIFYWLDAILFFFGVRFFIKLKKDDVLYTRDFLTLLFFSRRRKIFLEVHDIPSSRFLFHKLIKKPKGFFVLNENIKKILVEMGVSENKILISPSGVEISDFNIKIDRNEARKKINLPADRNIIMYTGHLYSWKGVEVLAETARLMPEKLFVFVGGVEPEISLFKAKHDAFKNIIIKPFIERKQIPFYLKSADVLVLPNLANEKISSDYTSPLKMFEYMASKRPIIASDLPSVRQILTDESAFFVSPNNPDLLAGVIKKIFSDSSASDRKVASAWNDVQRYTWKARTELIVDFIKNENTL